MARAAPAPRAQRMRAEAQENMIAMQALGAYPQQQQQQQVFMYPTAGGMDPQQPQQPGGGYPQQQMYPQQPGVLYTQPGGGYLQQNPGAALAFSCCMGKQRGCRPFPLWDRR